MGIIMKKVFKVILIVLIVIIVLWGVVFAIDYIRYKNDKEPMLQISSHMYDYYYGSVHEYTSFGYKYIEYDGDSGKNAVLVPFWVKIQSVIGDMKRTYIKKVTGYDSIDIMDLTGDALIEYYQKTAYECLNAGEKARTSPENGIINPSIWRDGCIYQDLSGEMVHNKNIKSTITVTFNIYNPFIESYVDITFNPSTREILGVPWLMRV